MRFTAAGTPLVVAVAAACGPAASTSTSPAPREDDHRPEGELAVLDWQSTTVFLDSAIRSGAAPGAVLGVSYRGARMTYGTGRLGIGDPTQPDEHTVYDLASLTKVVGLTTAVMLAVEEGRMDLDAPVQRYTPRFQGPGKDSVTIRHLLTHSSGLPAWRPLYLDAPTRDSALALVYATELDTAPGTVTRYSDLGAILLTEAVQAVWGMRLDSLLAQRVFGPLGMTSTTFRPPVTWIDRIAPTEDDPWRGYIVRGEVHDENAFRLEGVSGHAGLFSSTDDLLTFGEWLLEAFVPETPAPVCFEGVRCGAGPSPAVPPPSLVPMFATRQELVSESSRALGWDTPSGLSTAGTLMSAGSFGHTGFTGTSIWIDPTRRLVVVLLTNRVHPSREDSRIGPVRRGVADHVVLTLDPNAQPRPDAVVEAR